MKNAALVFCAAVAVGYAALTIWVARKLDIL